jgi:Sigma-54 interaction domain
MIGSRAGPWNSNAVGDHRSGYGVEIIGQSGALERLLKRVETVRTTDSTVLISGETGTGKELMAKAIHNLSPRRECTIVSANCAAIPAGLLESELFGHERGAYTGAITREIGRFELAGNGCVFLDEVGDIPLELQSKLLRVLQGQELERLGLSCDAVCWCSLKWSALEDDFGTLPYGVDQTLPPSNRLMERAYGSAADPDCFAGARAIRATPMITSAATPTNSPRSITFRYACTAIREA